jgi:hypothetical protein
MNAGGRTVFLEDNPAWVHIDPTLEVYQVLRPWEDRAASKPSPILFFLAVSHNMFSSSGLLSE